MVYSAVGESTHLFDGAYAWIIRQLREGHDLDSIKHSGSQKFSWEDPELALETALQEFSGKGLLMEARELRPTLPRRKALATLGAASMILLPRPSAAASPGQVGGCCIPQGSTQADVCMILNGQTTGTLTVCDISFHGAGSNCGPGAGINTTRTANCTCTALPGCTWDFTFDTFTRVGSC